MMPSQQIHFWLKERVDPTKKTGKVYVLYGQLVGESVLKFYTWETQPSKEVLDETMELIVRSMQYYHDSLEIPPFTMSIVPIEREKS